MSKNQITELKPFFSILMIIGTLFVLVFFKMEVRRVGYSVLKEDVQHQKLQDRYHLRSMELARVTRYDRVRKLAESQLTLHDAGKGQIIQLSGKQIAVPQYGR